MYLSAGALWPYGGFLIPCITLCAPRPVPFGNNFRLLGGRREAKPLPRTFYGVTSKNALITAETRDPYLTDNPVHFRYHAWNRKRGRMSGQLHMRVRFMQYATPWYDYLIVSKDEMRDILQGTGWKAREFINAEGFRQNGQYMAIIGKIQ